LEFPRHFTGPVFFRRQRGGASERAHQRDDDRAHLMPHEPNKERREDRRAEDDSERGLRQIAARRLVRKLPRDEFEMAFDQSEVGSRLIDARNCTMFSSGMRTLWQRPVAQALRYVASSGIPYFGIQTRCVDAGGAAARHSGAARIGRGLRY
jgi:hypothetical protein